MRIERGIQIELLDRRDKAVTIALSWELPPMSKKFGSVATNYSAIWKRVHTRSEEIYDMFRLAHTQMLVSHERKDVRGSEFATPLIERAIARFREFKEEIKTFPAEVSGAEHLIALQEAEKGFSALYYHLANARVGSPAFGDAVVFVERLCSWSFETLHRSDRILEKYFAINHSKA